MSNFHADGGYRLGRNPVALPSLGRDAVHRFDDPNRHFVVRYVASSLYGAALECLDWRRTPAPEKEAVQERFDRFQAEHIHGYDVTTEEPMEVIPEGWLSRQRVGHVYIESEASRGRFLDLRNAETLSRLGDHADVRRALSVAADVMGDQVRFDEGMIRSNSRAARSVTQAAARAVYDDELEFVGIRYASRLDDSETNWAIFADRVDVDFRPKPPVLLDPLDEEHCRAIRRAARLLGLRLPPLWDATVVDHA